MNANPVLLQMKYARVVALFAKKNDLTLEQSLEIFYNSAVYQLMREGISDMHCRSDQYLCEELKNEILVTRSLQACTEKIQYVRNMVKI